jgi:hypothetical protein
MSPSRQHDPVVTPGILEQTFAKTWPAGTPVTTYTVGETVARLPETDRLAIIVLRQRHQTGRPASPFQSAV